MVTAGKAKDKDAPKNAKNAKNTGNTGNSTGDDRTRDSGGNGGDTGGDTGGLSLLELQVPDVVSKRGWGWLLKELPRLSKVMDRALNEGKKILVQGRSKLMNVLSVVLAFMMTQRSVPERVEDKSKGKTKIGRGGVVTKMEDWEAEMDAEAEEAVAAELAATSYAGGKVGGMAGKGTGQGMRPTKKKNRKKVVRIFLLDLLEYSSMIYIHFQSIIRVDDMC
jgi:hypothetical protein